MLNYSCNLKQSVNGSNWEPPILETHILGWFGIFIVMKLKPPQTKESNLLILAPVSQVSSFVFVWFWILNMLSRIKQKLLFTSHQVKKKNQASSFALFDSNTFCFAQKMTHTQNYLQNVISAFIFFHKLLVCKNMIWTV